MPKRPRKPDIGIDRHGDYKLVQGPDNHSIAAIDMGKDILVLGLSTYDGKLCVDIRKYFLTPGPDERWHPTKQGIRVPANHAGEVLDFIHEHRDVVLQLLGEK